MEGHLQYVDENRTNHCRVDTAWKQPVQQKAVATFSKAPFPGPFLVL